MPRIFAVFLLGISVFAQLPQQNVLILNSYDQKFIWTRQITEGIQGILAENDNLNIYIESMNIAETQQLSFYSMLADKYKELKFDAVITVDYEAFDFAKQYRNELWEEVPIVSCGISHRQAMSIDSTNSTWSGIYEYYNVPSQIDFINRMQNSVQRIIFITDNSDAGQDIREQLKRDEMNIEEWNNLPWESLPERLSQLDPELDAVVMSGTTMLDSTKYINKHSKAPIYSFWDVSVQNGVIGGYVLFAPLHGKNTGLLVSSVLTEKNFRYGFQKSANIFLVDEKAAASKNLNLDKLPPETIRINKADSWLVSKYQAYVSNMINVIIAELVIIVLLGFAFYAYFKRLNRKLQQEMNAAKEANKAKSLFLANMSHEIRTPLNSILGFSELLSRKNANLNEEQREWCKTIEISSYHLRDTFNNIMDFSKIEAGTLKIEEEWIDIFSLLDDLIGVCRHYLLYKNIRFYVMPSIAMPKFVKTDPVKLKQVLVNLVSNALKFTSKGSVKLTVNYAADLNDCRLFFEIVDTGIGIPKENIKKIFNAFEQIDKGHARKYGGSGLGLSISQNILRAMHSNLEVQSSDNGSRFYFLLKVKTKEDAFYKKFLGKENQKVALHNQDKKVLEYMSKCVEAVKGTATISTDIETILRLEKQDLLIAEADRLTNAQIQRIAAEFPRVMMVFYKESDRIGKIKHDFPKFECILAPVKCRDTIEALRRLYAD